jgi:PAS domain S-box-containing protein
MAASFQGFRSLIENSPDAISLIDLHGEILYGSASTTKIFGYHPEVLLGRNCLELIHPEDRDHSSRALQDVLAKPPGPRHWDARVRCKDSNYSWVESTVSNLLFECEVQAIVMQQRDINARKAAEAERQQHAEQLAHSNLRLEEFAYTAAHDLREPLRQFRCTQKCWSRRRKWTQRPSRWRNSLSMAPRACPLWLTICFPSRAPVCTNRPDVLTCSMPWRRPH